MRSFLILFLILYGLMLSSILIPDREYSTSENKYLSEMPSFSLKSLLNGTFFTRYGDYVADHIPGRDLLIAVRSVTESVFLKTENNGVIYGKDGFLFQKFGSYSEEDLMDNISAVNSFAAKASAPVTVMIVPSSYTVLSDKLPDGAQFADQKSILSADNSDGLGHML